MDFDGVIGEGDHQDLVTTCKRCSTGVMQLSYITHFIWLKEDLITVPNFPAWVCDICGRRRFDPRAIAWLNLLLNPASKRDTRSRSRFVDEVPRSDSLQS
jgi:YgiT-type zinc finger domain-containing protein